MPWIPTLAELTLSLQELCYLTLVGHLDHYTPEYLALLPPTLRRQLFARLPAVDLYRIDGTVACAEIDMAPYWEIIYQSFKLVGADPQFPFLWEQHCGHAPQSVLEYRNMYMDKIAQHVVRTTSGALVEQKCQHLSDFVPLATLVSVGYIYRHILLHDGINYCTDDVVPPANRRGAITMFTSAGLEVVCSHHCILVPKRLQLSHPQPWACDEGAVLLIMELLVLLRHYPKFVCYHSNLPKAIINHIEEELVQRVLGGATVLALVHDNHLSVPSIHDATFKLQTLMEAMVARGRSMCRTLYLGIPGTMYTGVLGEEYVQEVTRLLETVPALGMFCESIEELYMEKISNTIRGRQVRETGVFHAAKLLNCLRNLRRVILKQFFVSCPEFITALSNLVRRPCFESLSFMGSNVDEMALEGFTELLVHYLTSPATHLQQLSFNSLKITSSDHTMANLEELASRVDEMALPPNINHDKSLVLKSMTIDSNAFPVLQKLPHIRLNTIHITNLLAPHLFLVKLPNITSSTIIIEGSTQSKLPHNSTRTQEFLEEQLCSLLTRHRLEKLVLIDLKYFSNPVHMKSLAKALTRHATDVGTLKSIVFHTCMLNNSEEATSHLFLALLELSNVVDLDLTVNEPRYKLQELLRLCDTWTSHNAPKQLLKLTWNLSLNGLSVSEDVALRISNLTKDFNHYY